MRIAVYPGSFDPLHIGHQAIMEYLTQDGWYDWVYLVISPQNPFKDPSKALNAQQRYEAAVDAVCRHSELHVWVDDIELHMPAPHYTIRTLDVLREREPENEFSLVMGADNLAGLTRWYEAERLVREYPITVYPRRGFDIEAEAKALSERFPECRIRIADAPMVDISSTQIREGLAKGEDMSTVMM